MDNEEFKGLIPRIVEQIFHSIISSPSTMEYTVKVSYMEIYMEKIRDLLNRLYLILFTNFFFTNGMNLF
jgi:kinesin family protein 5